ncbi:phosphoserine phosphatase SerB [Methylococcus capsulatus]|uniref:Phosphoserine phosphatase n=1 Tax=Methylococcus capsulatus (strain ATCC 33009 / NCIMB 11132 / Bath) TaxID=243233 RepID=Q609G7_METCA|nr:phosphoserine phosphatase SerB [Methylococcus capsulatus]AAU92433.1 phosphoserine phosphatase [Methylococcus capsulatus str. Bath]QXP90635.1 phosphoserine phosphatase SerB [Methylococcus capsulatus]
MYRTLIHTARLADAAAASIQAAIPGRLEPRGGHWLLRHERPAERETVEVLRRSLRLDINPLPPGFVGAAVGLLVTDMDSTLIAIECIDELADRAGQRQAVMAITEAAMNGKLDFVQALQRRVALLRGLPVSVLQAVYAEKVVLNPGAESLVAACRRHGVRIGLVSGGFDFFVDRLKDRLGLDFALANRLESRGGFLTGRIEGPICGGAEKAGFLLALCGQLGLVPQNSIGLGDGANDAKLLGVAGLGVGYRPKPALRAVADAVIEYADLAAIADFLEDAR